MESNKFTFDKNYSKKNFNEKIKYLFEQTKLCFNTLQNQIKFIRGEYDNRQATYQELIEKKEDIIIPDTKIFEKEYKMQKNMLQNDLIYAVNSRDIVFLEFYQDIFSIFENLISLEMGIKPEKMLLGYNNYKNQKLKDVRENIDLNKQSFEELDKLKSIVLSSIEEIEKSLVKHKEYLKNLTDKSPEGLDVNTFCISMKTLITKIDLELESNKKQFIYQMEDDLVKIYSINKKIQFMSEIDNESSRKIAIL